MREMPPYIRFFDDGAGPDHALLGGKCASLVAMTAAGMPVPPGFAVTTALYDEVVHRSGLAPAIRADLRGPEDLAAVDAASARIRHRIATLTIPADLCAPILSAYAALQERFAAPAPVAVRSSATAEDLPGASFAGQQDTYLWVSGADAVLEHIRRCWASLYTCRAILYRARNGVADEGLSMAVAVQKMVNARVAGVALTVDPTNGDRSKVVIDASYGLGEMVVSGRVTPDNVVLDKVMACVVTETIGDKHAELVPDIEAGRLVEREVDGERRRRRCLTHEELTAILALAKRAERHYGCPQDIEWALDGKDLFLLQARPETVHSTLPVPAALRAAPAAPASTLFSFFPAEDRNHR
jgi:pyruvate, water dikinase